MKKLSEVFGLPVSDEKFIKPVEKPELATPLRVQERWVSAPGGSLYKRFRFKDNGERDRFVMDLLGYESEIAHNAAIKIVDRQVMLSLITHGVGMVTELDKEYANEADLIYREVTTIDIGSGC